MQKFIYGVSMQYHWVRVLFFLVAITVTCSADVKIGSLDPSRWGEYRELRLQALAEDRRIFGSLQDELRKSDADWLGILIKAQAQENQWLVFAESDGKLIGMVGAIREYADSEDWKHIVTIVSVFVDHQHRGKGIATQLMEELLNQLERNPSVHQAMLWVHPESKAIRLYESLGFSHVGTFQRAVKIGELFYDNYIMQKSVERFR